MIKKSRNYSEDLSITVRGASNEETLQIANIIKSTVHKINHKRKNSGKENIEYKIIID